MSLRASFPPDSAVRGAMLHQPAGGAAARTRDDDGGSIDETPGRVTAHQVNCGESRSGLRWKRAPHTRRRLMRNSRHGLILLIAILMLSSGVFATPQTAS